jgi:DNA-directed RNA polymerase specialized sigma24 family protein
LQRNNEKKRWLWRYQDCVEREKEINLRIEKIRNELGGLKGISYDGMPGSGSLHDLSDGMVKLMEEEEKLLQERERMAKTWREIQEAITSPELTSKQTEVCFKRYILRMWWDDIAEEMGVNERSVYRYHGEALKRIRIPKEK